MADVDELRAAADKSLALKSQIELLEEQYETETYKLEKIATSFLRFIPGKSSQYTKFEGLTDDGDVVFETFHSDWELLEEISHGRVTFSFAELADAEKTSTEIQAKATREAEKARKQSITILENRLERLKGK